MVLLISPESSHLALDGHRHDVSFGGKMTDGMIDLDLRLPKILLAGVVQFPSWSTLLFGMRKNDSPETEIRKGGFANTFQSTENLQ